MNDTYIMKITIICIVEPVYHHTYSTGMSQIENTGSHVILPFRHILAN